MQRKTDFYIDGAWVPPVQKNDFDVINPSTEEICAVISLGSAADVDKAVAAARKAFESYSQSSKDERLALLSRLMEIMVRRKDEMGDIISMEMGAPVDYARGAQAGCGPHHLQGFIEALREMKFEAEFKGPQEIITREPIGVCGLITPWNWPVNQIALKVIPALAAGCSCILKPSEIAPLSAILFAEMIDEAGFPAGSFNLVQGDGLTVGEAMSRHPDIDMMSFTGSTRAGSAVQQSSAAGVKRVALELGGKSPNIIFEAANVESAVKRGVIHCMNNAGQSCNAPTRMLVQRSVYDKAIDAARNTVAKIKVDQSHKHGRHIGPVISETQYNKIQGLIQKAIDEGTPLLAGGPGRPEGFEKGYFVQPTIFHDVTNDMTIAREEIFGPVLAILPFDTEEAAIRIANDTEYGLAAYVQTQDKQQANRVARKLRAGMIHINGADQQPGSPFGGYKKSGIGREGGKWGLEDFLEIKSIVQ